MNLSTSQYRPIPPSPMCVHVHVHVHVFTTSLKLEHVWRAISNTEISYTCCMHVKCHITCIQNPRKLHETCMLHIQCKYKCNLHVTGTKVNACFIYFLSVECNELENKFLSVGKLGGMCTKSAVVCCMCICQHSCWQHV